MNTGQIQLVVGALAILATLQLAINSSILGGFISSYDSEATIVAISIGESMSDEAMSKAFDQYVNPPSPDSLTSASKLGPDGFTEFIKSPDWEPFQSSRVYNDFDDYNKYVRKVSTPDLGDFQVRDSVIYVSGTDLDSLSNKQTWYKKLVVTVTHPNLLRPITVRTIKAYRKAA